MYARVILLVLVSAFVNCVSSFDSRNVVFVIISQQEPYLASVASRLKQEIESQVFKIERRNPQVLLTHEDLPIPGGWTIIPLLRPLIDKYEGSDVRWVMFVESHTAVRCEKLLEALAAADNDKDIEWIGYPLSDDEPTIIHHFAIYEELEEEGGFVYPNFACGFAMRMNLIKTLIDRIASGQHALEADFSIDPAYELAQLVYGGRDDPGPLLTADPSFCIVSGDNCATYPRQFDTCGSPIPEESVLFAVKTWSSFHATRARVVKKTWGRHVTNLLFFSDQTDPSLPAVDTGVPNTSTGHCDKTMVILKEAVNRARSMPHVKWIFLADDDTILGVQRLCEVLSCYRGGNDYAAIGERYGYRYVSKDIAGKGYDYLTGGGGVALSVSAAAVLSRCVCVSASAPEDMTLGACAREYGVPLTHSPLFHQARPQDYPREVLSRDRPVSFHRHSSPDPYKVYATWFQHDDLALKLRHRDELMIVEDLLVPAITVKATTREHKQLLCYEMTHHNYLSFTEVKIVPCYFELFYFITTVILR
ncbi:beta-1,3-glucosyltransferase-like isoform X2 [Choristoneura fumiferana]|uniref:beta-1,3-glucosyltransferase-like isoform X2 n=1 Tax=Choristoneura fumiferana TaxID=7141 RepID=UPI003D156496